MQRSEKKPPQFTRFALNLRARGRGIKLGLCIRPVCMLHRLGLCASGGRPWLQKENFKGAKENFKGAKRKIQWNGRLKGKARNKSTVAVL